MFTKLMKGVMLAGCLYLAMMSFGCGGGGGDESASPTSTNPPTSAAQKNYATIDELAADMKTPEALGAWMVQNITYLNPSPPDMSNWKYLSPSEVFSGRTGDCIHQSAFEKEVLIKNGYACKLLFVQRNNRPDHAVCYWPDANGKLLYLENAWRSHQGIQGPFDNEHAMAAKILEWLIAQDPGEPQTAIYGNFDSLAYGIGWNDFYQPFVSGPMVP
jgi:hypothetical protein